MSSGKYMAYSPSPSAPHSPHISGIRSATNALLEQEKYPQELLAERQKLVPFMPLLPHSYRLLNKEILRVTALLGNAAVLEQTGFEHGSPMTNGGLFSNGAADINGWASAIQSEPSTGHGWFGSKGTGIVVKKTIRVDIPVDKYPMYNFVGRLLGPRGNSLKRVEATTDCRVLIRGRGSIKDPARPSTGHGWFGSKGTGIVVKKTIRVDIPVDKYPMYNFVGRLLGPRGNSLKRVEATTDCRVLIRGRGSIKDPAREEMIRGKPGYEHLNEPLHILVEAELPVEMIDARLMQTRDILQELIQPVDEAQDFFKKQQLRELAMLNGTLHEEDSHMSGSVSPFHNSLGMKRAKTRV